MSRKLICDVRDIFAACLFFLPFGGTLGETDDPFQTTGCVSSVLIASWRCRSIWQPPAQATATSE